MKKIKRLFKKIKDIFKTKKYIIELPVYVSFKREEIKWDVFKKEKLCVKEMYKFLIWFQKKLYMNYEKEWVEYMKLLIREFILWLEKWGFDIKNIKDIF